ncbi:ribosome-binding factor A [Melittangium boletus]|uniref:Ribosome-binding factor A n=1 Tax=Melittangium boletus DSM 14713 TaxID=1294270 RepID=A0A250IPG5_9BACT|nr:ribosome-binding factor A [Melittangium boletus]ATB33634.1 ribosome-binding factor A [Melittangium boletus DSM 14713]
MSSEVESIPARHLRVQSTLFQEVSRLFRGELSDPLLEGVAVTSLELTPDGRNARIGFTLPPELAHAGPAPVEAALTRASGFIRAQLALGLDLKRVPHLRFIYVGVAFPELSSPESGVPTWDEESEEGGES